jgi:outer membrane protein assembly factor BamB
LKLKYAIFQILFFVFSCKTKTTELTWQKSFGQIGSQSSPNTADFNADGILDIVIGAGKNEYQPSEFGVMALDGKTGNIIWQHEASDQIYQTATLLDINNDKTEDVIIGGRSNNLFALDGKTGQQIWKFDYKFEADSILKYTKFNFQNAKIIPDQNKDGVQDLLVQEGGNHKAAPNTMKGREPGVLMVMDSKTGKILFADKMPDGMESYMPPLYFKQPDNEEYIVFGTGGETISGSLFIAKFDNLKNKTLRNATIISEDIGHGFIAPSIAADINADGYFDIISISHGSKISAIDGKTLQAIWQNKVSNTECSNAFAVGNFNGDNIPDFFTFVSKGIWPDSKGSVQIMIDGATGKIEYQNTLGCTGFSSAVVYDLNSDGSDEAIISINEYDCEKGFVGNDSRKVTNKLLAIDFTTKKIQTIEETLQFKNIFSTPLLADIDHDKYLDIIHCQYYSAVPDPLLFMGMQIKRISTHVKIDKPITWGKYMGTNGDGLYK